MTWEGAGDVIRLRHGVTANIPFLFLLKTLNQKLLTAAVKCLIVWIYWKCAHTHSDTAEWVPAVSSWQRGSSWPKVNKTGVCLQRFSWEGGWVLIYSGKNHTQEMTSCISDIMWSAVPHRCPLLCLFVKIQNSEIFEFKYLKKEKLLLYLMTFGKIHKFHRTKGSLILDWMNKPHSFIHAESSDVKSLRQRHEGSWGEETTPYRLHRNVTGYFCGEINSCFDMISPPSVPPPACESSPLRAEAWIIKHIKIHYWFRIC